MNPEVADILDRAASYTTPPSFGDSIDAPVFWGIILAITLGAGFLAFRHGRIGTGRSRTGETVGAMVLASVWGGLFVSFGCLAIVFVRTVDFDNHRRTACAQALGEISVGAVSGMGDALTSRIVASCREKELARATGTRESLVQVETTSHRQGDAVVRRVVVVPKEPAQGPGRTG